MIVLDPRHEEIAKWALKNFGMDADNDQVIGTLLWCLDNDATEVLLEIPDDAALCIIRGHPTIERGFSET